MKRKDTHTEQLSKFVERQRARPILGVFEATFKHSPGSSNISYYSNVDSIKHMHREKLEEIRLLAKHRNGFKKLGAA